MDANGRFWEPIPGQGQWPLPGQATTVTLITANDLVVSTGRGSVTQCQPAATQITCNFIGAVSPITWLLVWFTEGAAIAVILVGAWLVLHFVL